MKTIRITYWTTTWLLGLMMVLSAYAYLTQAGIRQGFLHLGFPDYFRVELAVAKLVGAVVLLAPFKAKFKEWAYVGFAISFISAFIAHTASGDPIANLIGPLMAMALLMVSYFTYHKQLATQLGLSE
jgi:hypothetical protein